MTANPARLWPFVLDVLLASLQWRVMFAWLRPFLVPPRYTLLGRLRYLCGRAADPALCQVLGADPQVTDRALALVCAAFLIPARQRYCLRPDDALRDLYLGGHRRLGDHMEFEHLFLALDDAPGRPLSEAEMVALRTVGDIARLLAAAEEPGPHASGAQAT